MPSHEQNLAVRWNDVHSSDQFMSFLQQQFSHKHVEYYLYHVRHNLLDYEYRQENPLYLPFASRILLITAEHQMPGVVGHLKNHTQHQWPCDFMAPQYLLALGVYLAKSAVILAEKKGEVAAEWDKWLEDEYKHTFMNELLDAWVKPYKLETFPDAHTFVDDVPKRWFNERRKYSLPVYIADTEFLRKVATIPFSGSSAVEMKRDDFAAAILPYVQPIFFPYEEPILVENMFLQDRSWE